MKKYLSAVIVGISFHLTALAESSVWKVEAKTSAIYLGGTIHILRSVDYPLPAEYEQAYQASSEIYFETDIDKMKLPEVQQKLLSAALAAPGRQLPDLLTKTTYRQLAEVSKSRGLDVTALSQFKVGMAVITLQVMEFMRLGFSSEGVDGYYNNKAKADNIPTNQLESIEDQINVLSKLGDGWEEEFMKASLRDINKMESIFSDMVKAWRTGDQDSLEKLVIDETKRDYPKAYTNLLVNRNKAWLPQIEKLIQSPGTEFVLVGVGHMLGEEGLLNLLKQRGYKITQLSSLKHNQGENTPDNASPTIKPLPI